MWKNAIYGLYLFNIEDLDFYRVLVNKDINIPINRDIQKSINGLPSLYAFLIKFYAFFIELLCRIFTFHSLRTLSAKGRSVFVKSIRFLPLFPLLNKLVRNLAFLYLFDYKSQKTYECE